MGLLKTFGKTAIALVTAASAALSALTVTAAAEEKKLPDNEAIVFADGLGAGWNLGNAFDAVNCTWLSDEMDYETGWCGAKTTKELIREIKNVGFSTIRVPVSWHNHVDASFKISEPWADRVQEVVDQCLDAGLKVILDVHHDVDKGFYFPTPDQYKNAEKYMTTVWKQIAERYKDYDERLLFEIINEPRESGSDHEWWFNANDPGDAVKKNVDCINRLNQASLDTIRAAGGKNADRYVVVSGYDTSIEGITVEGFSLPKDSAKNRLILAIHVYTKAVGVYTSTFKKAYEQYVSKGIPVIMDEYNFDSGNNKYHAKAATALGDMVKCARDYGISTVIWDNNAVEFKLIDRATVKWAHKDIAESIVLNGAPRLAGSDGKSETAEPNDSSKKDGDKTEQTAQSTAKKPVLTAKANGTKANLSWTAVDGAEKYRVYRYEDGKLKRIKETTKLKATVSGLKSGKTYRYAVRAYVDGKWTTVKTSDIKKVKIK